jgi:hypothetical protein
MFRKPSLMCLHFQCCTSSCNDIAVLTRAIVLCVPVLLSSSASSISYLAFDLRYLLAFLETIIDLLELCCFGILNDHEKTTKFCFLQLFVIACMFESPMVLNDSFENIHCACIVDLELDLSFPHSSYPRIGLKLYKFRSR